MTMEIVTDLLLDLPYFFIMLSRVLGETRRLSRAPVSEGRKVIGELSVLVLGKRVSQLGGINPPVTVNINCIKQSPPFLFATSDKKGNIVRTIHSGSSIEAQTVHGI
jgi:hypothetical protein